MLINGQSQPSMPFKFERLDKPALLIQQNNKLSGFSLIEIMVALVIGLLGMIVMMQIFSISEAQKRTTTSGGDAQNNGVIALNGLQRDLRAAGYGLNNKNLIGCSITLPTAGSPIVVMGPVTINNTAITKQDDFTDTLTIVTGNSNGAPDGDLINIDNTTSYAVASATSFFSNDYVIAEPKTRPTTCGLVMDKVKNTVAPNVTVTGNSTLSFTNGGLYNFGQSPKILVYAIRGGNLTVCDYMVNDCGNAANTGSATVWPVVGDNIVSLRAEYGRDTSVPMDAIVDQYDQTTPSKNTTSTTCEWLKVASIQLVLVARSGQPEKEVAGVGVTPDVLTWMGSAADTTTNPKHPTALPITLDNTPVPSGYSWHDYRYKTFQTIVPLRNITSIGVVSGC